MQSKLPSYLLLLFLVFFANQVSATEYTVSSASQFNSLSLQPCDVVTWTNGTYANQDIIFNAMGESGSPIVLKAETAGGVIFTGSSEMNIWGDYLIVDGFYWNGGTGTNNHVEFRRSGSNSDFANNSILRNCAFNGLATAGDDKSRWAVLYGTNNTIENCSFLNKESTGVFILVELSYHNTGVAGHKILNNYFYNVTPKDGRTNSGDAEGIRIGSSSKQTANAGVLVENNYFQKVDGENEIISNKSLGNIFRNNTFRNCRGSLVLRHGAQALVEGNYFIGENKAKSGGIRVSDQDHIIINNYMQGLDNTSDSFNNGITIMGGNAASGGTSNGYQTVSNVLIAFNTIYNSDDPIYFNGSRGSNIAQGTIANNLIYSTNGTIVSGDISSIGDQMTYEGNIFGGSAIGISDAGITDADGDFSASGEIFKPSSIGPAANAATGTYNDANIDIEGFTRPSTGKDVGAHEVDGATGTATNASPIIDTAVGNAIGACYLNFNGATASGTCSNISYGTNCAPIPVTGVSVSPETIILEISGNQQLAANITPSNATNIQVSWSSGDNAIALVDANGLVTAVNPGTTTITATTTDGSFTDTTSVEVLAPLSPPDCIEGTNLSLSGSVVSFTAEQAENPASNVIDGDTGNRWSAENFPQSMVFDLGDGFNINEINLHPYQSRDYQYLVEGSTTSATTGFTTLVDRQANTTSAALINDTFNLTVVRYIRLTVTGAATYTGPWVSIAELEIICAGLTLSTTDYTLNKLIKLFPNPFDDEINIDIPSNLATLISGIKLADVTGKVLIERHNFDPTNTLKFNNTLSKGLYFLQFLDQNGHVIHSKKIIKK